MKRDLTIDLYLRDKMWYARCGRIILRAESRAKVIQAWATLLEKGAATCQKTEKEKSTQLP